MHPICGQCTACNSSVSLYSSPGQKYAISAPPGIPSFLLLFDFARARTERQQSYFLLISNPGSEIFSYLP